MKDFDFGVDMWICGWVDGLTKQQLASVEQVLLKTGLNSESQEKSNLKKLLLIKI
jgi:hypothetical protein